MVARVPEVAAFSEVGDIPDGAIHGGAGGLFTCAPIWMGVQPRRSTALMAAILSFASTVPETLPFVGWRAVYSYCGICLHASDLANISIGDTDVGIVVRLPPTFVKNAGGPIPRNEVTAAGPAVGRRRGRRAGAPGLA